MAGAVGILQTGLGLFLNAFDFVGSLFGWMPDKKLRVRVWQLTDGSGRAVGQMTDIQAMVDLMTVVLRDEVNVQVVGVGAGPIVQQLVAPAPDAALTPDCGVTGFFQNAFGEAGSFYRKWSWDHLVGRTLGVGAAVTIYVVDDVVGRNGCAAPLNDFVVVEPISAASPEEERLIMTHEIGHACNLLPHLDGTIMNGPNAGRTRTFTSLQRALFRSSNHVWYF